MPTAMMPVVTVAGVVTGVLAFGAAALAIVGVANPAALLTAAGGLGALGFGAAQISRQLNEGEAARRRARVTARLARRSLVAMVNGVDGVLKVSWIGAIGCSGSIAPV